MALLPFLPGFVFRIVGPALVPPHWSNNGTEGSLLIAVLMLRVMGNPKVVLLYVGLVWVAVAVLTAGPVHLSLKQRNLRRAPGDTNQ